jgi:hypothetical protein
MDVEEFQWPKRLLSRRISPKPGLVERGAPCSVRDPVWDRRDPFGVDVFGSAMQLFDQIVARVLGPGRSDASPANANDGKMARGRRARSSASGELRYSPSRDQNIRRLRAFTGMEPRPVR